MLLKNTKKAFTLIELLVVISIISILATLWVLNMSTAWADDTARLKSLNDIRVNLEDFKQKTKIQKCRFKRNGTYYFK